MKISKTNIIYLKVTMLFVSAILSTFISDYLSSFLGDYRCNLIEIRHHFGSYEYKAHYHWGYRHWLYFVMCVVLIVIKAVSIINYIGSEKK